MTKNFKELMVETKYDKDFETHKKTALHYIEQFEHWVHEIGLTVEYFKRCKGKLEKDITRISDDNFSGTDADKMMRKLKQEQHTMQSNMEMIKKDQKKAEIMMKKSFKEINVLNEIAYNRGNKN